MNFIDLPRTIFLFDPLYFAVTLFGFIVCVSLHHAAQAFVADRLGDRTARNERRLSLSPFVQLDALSLVLGTFLALGVIPIGWGKPVPLNAMRLKGGRASEALVALAGPLVNLLLAGLLALAYHGAGLDKVLQTGSLYVVGQITVYLIQLNLILFAFNLIPIPPLAGWSILHAFLPSAWLVRLFWLERWGVAILMVYMFVIRSFMPIINGTRFDPLGLLGWFIANYFGGLFGL